MDNDLYYISINGWPRVSLKEDDTLQPQIRYYNGVCKDNIKGETRYEIIVPTNTIKKNFNGMVNK
jgi:hypothetical protein